MAHAHHDDDLPQPERTDGALRCRLCPDPSPHPDNDWCPVTGGIVCEDCCRALMMGDPRALALASERRERQIDNDDVIAECSECARLIRLVSDRVLEGETDVRLPMH